MIGEEEQIHPLMTVDEEEDMLHQEIWKTKENIKFYQKELQRWEKLQKEFYEKHPELKLLGS